MKIITLFLGLLSFGTAAFAEPQTPVFVAECSLYAGGYSPEKTPLEVKKLYYNGTLPTETVEFKQSTDTFFVRVEREFVVHSHGVHYAAVFEIGINGHSQFGAEVVEGQALEAAWSWGLPGQPEVVANSLRCFNPSAPYIAI